MGVLHGLQDLAVWVPIPTTDYAALSRLPGEWGGALFMGFRTLCCASSSPNYYYAAGSYIPGKRLPISFVKDGSIGDPTQGAVTSTAVVEEEGHTPLEP